MHGYLISSINNSVSEVEKVIATVERLYPGITVKSWNSDNPRVYDESWLNESSFVILLPERNEFSSSTQSRCIINELDRAKKRGIPVFLAYRTSSRGMQFYETNVQNGLVSDHISGIEGTSGVFNKQMAILIDPSLSNMYGVKITGEPGLSYSSTPGSVGISSSPGPKGYSADEIEETLLIMLL